LRKCKRPFSHVTIPAASCPLCCSTVRASYSLTNTAQLKKELFIEDQRHLNTDSDSEVLLNIFAHELQQIGKLQLNKDDIFNAVKGVHRRCKGAYAVVVMIGENIAR
jgi:amidophosphoribosyltransferase